MSDPTESTTDHPCYGWADSGVPRKVHVAELNFRTALLPTELVQNVLKGSGSVSVPLIALINEEAIDVSRCDVGRVENLDTVVAL